MADFLEEKRKEIDSRLKELRPLVEEFERLEQAAAALAGVGGTSRGGQAAAAARRGGSAPSKPRTRKARNDGAGRRGRPRGSGNRGKQALELVKAKPGITIAQLAEQMNIKANYLYRVMPALEAEGLATKRDGGWYPASNT